MAAFGHHNYATPFGALSPSGFFDATGYGIYSYEGFSSRSGSTGFSGLIGFSGFCDPDGLEFMPWRPTLTFPLNYESLSGEVTISWKEAGPADVCEDPVAYEVQFTASLSTDSGWRTIGSGIPEGTSVLALDLSDVPFTEDGGIRVRARDSKGLYSAWSPSLFPFTVRNHAPKPVNLVSPASGERFDNYISAVWREAVPKDVDGHLVTYRLEATHTSSSGANWVSVPGAEALEEGTISFLINTFDFPDGDDFGIRVIAVDELGAESEPSEATRLSIRHSGTFFIDTVPPDGAVVINDGDPLAKSTRAKLTLFGSDVGTGVKEMRIRNADEGEDCWGDWDVFASEKFWDLTTSDGVKRVLVQYRDYAGNASEICDCEVVSRVLCHKGNAVDVEVFNNKLYVAFDLDGNLLEYKVLVRTAAELDEPELTALARLENFLYIAAYDGADSAIYRFDGVSTFLVSITGKVSSMVAYNDLLYIGFQNGRILELDGTSTSVSYEAAGAVTLRTDGAILFATVENASEYLTFDGATWTVNQV
jgi:hypothetical protein